MATDAPRRPWRHVLAAGLLAYGAVGVAVQLRLAEVAQAGLTALGGTLTFMADPGRLPGFATLTAHFDALPALPWAAWLLGLVLLGTATPHPALSPEGRGNQTPAARRVARHLLWLLPLAALLLLAAWARLNQIVPPDYGLTHDPWDDEGVYAGTAQLSLQGIWPYRDYFFAHPPLAALAYAPAMAYHYTPWGSPTSFMDARYAAVLYGLAGLIAVFAVGWQLGGRLRWGRGGDGTSRPGAALAGTLAAGLWALDGRIVEINRKIMLDQPMVLASVAGLAVYLWAVRRAPGRGTTMLFVLAGALAGASALTKIAGAACFLALLADALWRALSGRGGRLPGAGRAALALTTGFVAVAAAVAAPFLILAPGPFLRDVVLFQVLRPTDCTVIAAGGDCSPAGRIADLSASLQNGPTTLLAALGLLILTAALVIARIRNQGLGSGDQGAEAAETWRPVVLWSLASVVLFTYTRSFYGHYYIQLAAPLCVLGAGLAWWWDLVAAAGRRPVRLALGLAPAVLLLTLGPLTALDVAGVTAPHQDRLYVIVSRYVTDAVPPDAPVLTTDEQFNLLAARAPSHTATGYLVDSYGHLLALGLGLETRSWGDLIGAALRGEHGADPYHVMWQPAAQADWLDRARAAALVVVHAEGDTRLTPGTLAALRAQGVRIDERRYVIYSGGAR